MPVPFALICVTWWLIVIATEDFFFNASVCLQLWAITTACNQFITIHAFHGHEKCVMAQCSIKCSKWKTDLIDVFCLAAAHLFQFSHFFYNVFFTLFMDFFSRVVQSAISRTGDDHEHDIPRNTTDRLWLIDSNVLAKSKFKFEWHWQRTVMVQQPHNTRFCN